MYDFVTNEAITGIINKSNHKEKSIEVISYLSDLLKEENINITGYRWQSLVNHVVAMVERRFTKKELEGIEEEMFSEVSKRSIGIAERVVSKIGNLPKNESYLLSIHFETAEME